MILRKSLLAAAAVTTLVSSAFADVAFLLPTAGQKISGDSISVKFAPEGDQYPGSQFTSYTLQLCAGGNDANNFDILLTFTDKGQYSSLAYTADIPNMAVGGNNTNAYFLRTVNVAPEGVVIHYSDRFTLSDMIGQFSSKVKAALPDESETSGPPTEDKMTGSLLVQRQAAAGPAASYEMPYTAQDGPTRFAPMPSMPGSKITKKGGPSPQYPTSFAGIWAGHTNLAPPNAQTTITASETFQPSMREATHISAQPGPAGDAQRFLERWKD